jgi:hypothetical protein
MPIDSVRTHAEISSEASGLCTMKECAGSGLNPSPGSTSWNGRELTTSATKFISLSGAAIRIAETGISTRQELVPETAGACLRAGFFRVSFGNSKKS